MLQGYMKSNQKKISSCCFKSTFCFGCTVEGFLLNYEIYGESNSFRACNSKVSKTGAKRLQMEGKKLHLCLDQSTKECFSFGIFVYVNRKAVLSRLTVSVNDLVTVKAISMTNSQLGNIKKFFVRHSLCSWCISDVLLLNTKVN